MINYINDLYKQNTKWNMKMKYRIKGVEASDDAWYFVVQVRRWFGWVNIKKFQDPDDESYALRCAKELLEKLNEEI